MKAGRLSFTGKSVMTRIMTITSGLPGAGKTQLSINIALEQVRRGRQAGVFHACESATPIEGLLTVPQPVSMLRRAGDTTRLGLLRSGYQGVDIISCGTPLRDWPAIQVEQRTRYIREMDVQGDYDDFLMDTSAMDARSLLACCRVSSVVVLVVTPEPRSCAEAFALLRVLQLNGFAGQLRLLVNKVCSPAAAKEIHDKFYHQVNSCLGLDIPLLGVIPQDENVTRAQHARQAFSSMFPESAATSGIFKVVDALDDIPVQFFSAPCTLPALWQALIDVIQRPVALPGGRLLDDGTEAILEPERLSAG
jgi:flagellar biosynthesis protein FlhG